MLKIGATENPQQILKGQITFKPSEKCPEHRNTVGQVTQDKKSVFSQHRLNQTVGITTLLRFLMSNQCMIDIFSVCDVCGDKMLKCIKRKMQNKLNRKFRKNIIIYVYKFRKTHPWKLWASREAAQKILILYVSLLRITHFEHLKLLLIFEFLNS